MWRRARRGAGWLVCLAALLTGCDDGSDAGPDTQVTADGGDPEPEPMPDGAVDPDDGVQPDGGPTPDGPIAALMQAVDMTRYADDLEFIARGPRQSPDGAHWQAAQDRCAEVFLAAGFEVTRQPFYGGGVNVIGVLPGTARPDEHVVLAAHYDTEFECNGADDNASGVAGVLEAARVLGARRFERTLVFACFDAEEYTFRGSIDYVLRAQTPQPDIRGMIALEMIGYTDDRPGSQGRPEGLALAFPALGEALDAREDRGDFLLYAADDDPEMIGALQSAAASAGLPLIGVQLDRFLRESPLTGAFQRSDHVPFWAAGYPGMMLTDTAEYRNPNYHCTLGDDDIGTIDMDFAVTVTTAVVGGLAAVAVPAEGPPAEGRIVEPAAPRSPLTGVCDPIGQDCDDGQRCALVLGDIGALVCAPPPAEPLGLDAPCARAADGSDTCEPGLFCTQTGRPLGAERRCRTLCLTRADCEGDELCPWLGFEASNCVATCDLFDDDCPDGTKCGLSVDNGRIDHGFGCRLAGDADEGAACGSNDCRPGLVCGSALSLPADIGCVAWCRVSAPDCGEGRTCRHIPRAGIDEDIGVCLPTARLP